MELDPTAGTGNSSLTAANSRRAVTRSPLKPDTEMKLLLQELEIQVSYGRDKERKIERLVDDNNRLLEEGEGLSREADQLAKQVAEARHGSMETEEEESNSLLIQSNRARKTRR